MRPCLILALLLAACDAQSANKQTDADRDRCQQYNGGHVATAVAACTRLLQAHDGALVRHVHAYRWRAQAFIDLQEWERAKADFRKVLDLDPGDKFAAERIKWIEELQEYELRTGRPAMPK
jgi:hypothetical protein